MVEIIARPVENRREGAASAVPVVPLALLLLAALLGAWGFLTHRAPVGPVAIVAKRAPTPDAPATPAVTGGAAAVLTATIPEGVTALVADASYTPERCNTEFRGLLEGKSINFTTASATVETASKPLLDELAALAGKCSGNRITVEGHTDTVGSPESNLTLSRDRAATVATYLIEKGVNPAQLSAIGFGQGRMKQRTADNTANATNRRIEIMVAG